MPDLEDIENRQAPSETHNSRIPGESNTVVPFSTARTHFSISGPSPQKDVAAVASPLKIFASQQSKVASQSPRTAAGVRYFADIATDQSPPRGSGETDVDVDAIMSDVMTAEDQQVIDAILSPGRNGPQKRRKPAHAPSAGVSTRSKKGDFDTAQQPTLESEDPLHETAVLQTNAREHEETEAQIATTVHALQDSPSKANELPRAKPKQKDQFDSTPQSVKEREQAGAKTISQLISSRPSKVPQPAKNNVNSKKGAHVQKNGRKPASAKVKLKAPRKLKRREPLRTPDTAEVALGTNSEDTKDQPHNLENRTVEGNKTDEVAILAPDRVFALFKGQYNAFYPARFLGISADGSTYRVKFEDDIVTSLETHLVRTLDLKIGDQVKVNVPGMRNKTWHILNFGPVAQNAEEFAAETDIYGHMSVDVQAKSTRSCLPTSTAASEGEGEAIRVAMSAVYLTHTMWPHFRDRTSKPQAVFKSTNSKAATPSTGVETTDTEIPTSRSRRTIIPTARAWGERISHLREESVEPSSTQTGIGGLFTGMAFAISYGSNEGEKANVTRLIQQNGGLILESGFEELFTIPSLDESAPTSPATKSLRRNADVTFNDDGLQLKPEYQSLTFVALIADKHSRRAKYVQALALGLPTLSGRWIVDSLQPSKTPSGPTTPSAPSLPWSRYLLPAGESAYLNGAIRSRTIFPYTAEDAKLADTIAKRENLLNGDGVLIVAPKKNSKAIWERRKAYAFLTLALGAGCVKRVLDLEEARAWTGEGGGKRWRWVYVDGDVVEACKVVFGGGGKKRKREGGAAVVKVGAKAMFAAGEAGVRVVNDEFVVQSLILGALVE